MPCKTVCKLQVLPPFPSYSMSYMNRFAGAVETQLMVAQREHADDLGDRRDAAACCSHAEGEANKRVVRVASSSIDSANGERKVFMATFIVCWFEQLVS